jgi:SAM-dependent methyltransferase
VQQNSELARYFDQWYADMEHSPVKDEIEQRHLRLPPHLLSTSLLGWEGIAEVSAGLGLEDGDLLLDAACGRGGYGLEVAQRTGARLVGVDLSAEAVRQAREQASRLGRAAEFVVGALEATGLEARSVDAAMCIDAVQFADPPAAAYQELRRVVRPGGRVVLTCWEAQDPDDDRVPERLRRVDLRGGLTAAGFADVEVSEKPQWRTAELELWHEAAALDPGDDPALQSFRDEGRRVLERPFGVRRLLAVAQVPDSAA